MAVKITAKQLLDNGVHFGHQTHRWNPKMKRFILSQKNGIYIIDLAQTIDHINTAYDFVRQTVANGGSVMFVGTKRQAHDTIATQATRVGQPYINNRWLGGLLTNFQTISKRLTRLKELEGMDFSGQSVSLNRTKKEALLLEREKTKLVNVLGGIKDMKRLPAAIWVVDIIKEKLAVDEARKLGIPVIAIADTNVDPELIDYPIAGNDDAIRSVETLTTLIADAVAEGLLLRANTMSSISSTSNASDSNVDAVSTETNVAPMAEWELELLGLEADANVTSSSSSVLEAVEAEESAKEQKDQQKATKSSSKAKK